MPPFPIRIFAISLYSTGHLSLIVCSTVIIPYPNYICCNRWLNPAVRCSSSHVELIDSALLSPSLIRTLKGYRLYSLSLSSLRVAPSLPLCTYLFNRAAKNDDDEGIRKKKRERLRTNEEEERNTQVDLIVLTLDTREWVPTLFLSRPFQLYRTIFKK